MVGIPFSFAIPFSRFPVCYTPLLDLRSSILKELWDAAKLTQIPFPFACAFDYECSLPCASGSWELFQAQDLSFPFSFALITGHLLVFICIGVRELVQRNIFFKLLTFGEAYLI